MEPRCVAHPEIPAAGTCERCGAFACAEDLDAIDGQALCASCAPQHNYLELFRQRHWGKRDGFAWLMAMMVPIGALMATGADTWGPRAVSLALAAAGALYFLGRPWGRPLIFAPAAVTLVLLLDLANAGNKRGQDLFGAIAASLVLALGPLLLGVGAWFDGRNQLFFRVPLSERKLKRTWNLLENNNPARLGFWLSLFGMVAPPMLALSLVLSIAGLRRVNPKASPPIGRRGQALAGIILSVSGLLVWGLYAVTLSSRGR